METFLIITLATICGGIIQSTTGFGLGIFVMAVLPSFMPVVYAAATAGLLGLFTTSFFTFKYRKNIKFKYTIIPLLFYFIFVSVAVRFTDIISPVYLKAILSIFLISLAFFFMFFNDKINIKANKKME